MTGGVESLRVAVRWLGNAIAASMVLMFVAVALPWFVRMIEVELAPLAWTLTAFAAIHALLMIAADRVQSHSVMLRLLYAVPVAGAGFMAALWHFGGGARHPALALAMVLPVFAAAALPRVRFAFDVALYSIAAVLVTVVITSPDFSWYLTQLGFPPAALAAVASDDALAREPFPGATTTPAAAFLAVLTFAAVQLAAAFVATRVARFIRTREELALRVHEHGADTLPALALEASPAASITVVAATGQILHASKRFRQRMLLHHEPLVGSELQSLLAFADAGALRKLLDEGGSLEHCRYRVGPEERVARVSATRFEQDGTAYANVIIDDEEDESALLPVALLLALLCTPAAAAQDALVVSATADRLSNRNGGGVSVLWIHPVAARNGGAMLFAGASVLSLADARWAYATLGGMRRLDPRLMLHGEANLGRGSDDDGRFPYVLLRAGVTRELAQRLHGEAEWLQVNVARQQDGIARLGATFVAQPRLTVRGSLFQSLFGDNDVTLATMRADYDFSRVTAIAGFSAGTAVPALLQQGAGSAGRVREAFGGVAFDAAARRWTLLVTSREDHQRLSVTCRMPLR